MRRLREAIAGSMPFMRSLRSIDGSVKHEPDETANVPFADKGEPWLAWSTQSRGVGFSSARTPAPKRMVGVRTLFNDCGKGSQMQFSTILSHLHDVCQT